MPGSGARGNTPARLRSLVCALVVILPAACASGGSQGETAGVMRDITITVMNNAVNASQATFVLSPTVGARRTLGTVDAGRTGTFTAPMQVGNYQLIAQGTAGDRSIRFQLFGNTLCVTWDMSTNRITQSANCSPRPRPLIP